MFVAIAFFQTTNTFGRGSSSKLARRSQRRLDSPSGMPIWNQCTVHTHEHDTLKFWSMCFCSLQLCTSAEGAAYREHQFHLIWIGLSPDKAIVNGKEGRHANWTIVFHHLDLGRRTTCLRFLSQNWQVLMTNHSFCKWRKNGGSLSHWILIHSTTDLWMTLRANCAANSEISHPLSPSKRLPWHWGKYHD